MIDINLWKELAVFEKCGTLSKSAEELFISQPALSRSMNRLEEEIGVVIFNRSKNKITLNDNGKLAAGYAREIIRYEENAIDAIRAFDKRKSTISIGSCAPIPLSELTEAVSILYDGFTVSSKIDDRDKLLGELKSDAYDICIFNQEIEDEELICFKTCSEKLYLNIDKNHPLAKKEGIYLSELNNQDILLYSEIGFWYDLLKDKAPNANFLVQHDNNTFNTLLNTTSFPSFVTNKSIRVYGRNQSNYKVLIPILDKEATANYYSVILKENHNKFAKLFEFIKNKENSNNI